ncbi:hypothetical protein B0H14DRAFT_2678540 [Mycena olivaceomarginata]|nr:hypothetical protein B0H14DRAFT_2678540 [Mycena olivaceomarginata]
MPLHPPDPKFHLSRSLTCPIHRLPSEVLAEIFAVCLCCFTSTFEDDLASPSFETELERVAGITLLKLSRVCSRWHTIALGTPFLWSEIRLHRVLWDVEHVRDRDTVLGLIESSLKHIHHLGGMAPDGRVLDVLAAHSARWRNVVFLCPQSLFGRIAGLQGNLSRLHALEIRLWQSDGSALNMLESLPSLRHFSFDGPLTVLSKLAVERLLIFEYLDVSFDRVVPAMSLLPLFGSSTEFRLDLSMANFTDRDLPPVASDICGFQILVNYSFLPSTCKAALGAVFSALTLPHLQTLRMLSDEYNIDRSYPLPWPHAQFLALCSRSSLDVHLRSLIMYDVHITAPELLECLAALPSLECLTISDHQLTPRGGVDEHLITDALLDALTLKPESSESPRLVPRLRDFRFQSLMRFSDTLHLALLLSRVEAVCPFQSLIMTLPGHERNLEPDVVRQVNELARQGKLVFPEPHEYF